MCLEHLTAPENKIVLKQNKTEQKQNKNIPTLGWLNYISIILRKQRYTAEDTVTLHLYEVWKHPDMDILLNDAIVCGDNLEKIKDTVNMKILLKNCYSILSAKNKNSLSFNSLITSTIRKSLSFFISHTFSHCYN